IPTGPGEPRIIAEAKMDHRMVQFLPDNRQLLFNGTVTGHATRPYVLDSAGGDPRPLAAEGVTARWKGVSPDGRWFLGSDPSDNWAIYPIGAGDSRPIPHFLDKGEELVRWSSEQNFVFICRCDDRPLKILRYDLATGSKTLWREMMP